MSRDESFVPEPIEFIKAKAEARKLKDACKDTLSFGAHSDKFRSLNRDAVLTGLEAIRILGNAATHSKPYRASVESVQKLNADVMRALLLADDAGLIQPPLSDPLSPRESIEISRDAANHVAQVLESTFHKPAEPIEYLIQI